jgi:hypothetical protein
VIGSAPTGSVDALIDAVPLDRVAVPRGVDPLAKVTVPVGLPVSVAVKVTD